MRALRAALAMASLCLLVSATGVWADDVSNNLDSSIDAIAEQMPLNVGGPAGTTHLFVNPTKDEKPGCNLTGSTTLVISLASSNPAVATIAPAIVTFTSCGDTPAVTVTPHALGDATISATLVSNNTGASFNLAPVTFIAHVALPANTAPTVSVTGVAGGARYEFGSVPVATCSVTDAEDGNSSFAASLSAVSGSLASYGLGEQTASCSYTDQGGLTASASVTYSIIDTHAPALSLPADRTAEATGPHGAAVTFTATATDAVSGVAAVDCTPQSGATFALGATTVDCSATDAAGNKASGSFKVTVVDTTGPVIHLQNVTAEATSSTGAVVEFAASATDLVDGAVAVTCSATSGATFPIGSTVVSCTAKDKAGNETSASFTIKVQDTTKPIVTVPANIDANATGPNGATVTFSASAHDSVDGDLAATCTPASGSTFALGTTEVTCSATDKANNVGSARFTVTVKDNTAPVVTVPEPITAEATGASGATVEFTATALDAVDGPVDVTCEAPSGSVFPLGITGVTCSATDKAGNTGTAGFAVTIEDTTGPTVEVPASITAEATSHDGAAVTFTASATDLVDGAVAVTCSPASGSTFGLGETQVTCSAQDKTGNVGNGTFTVTVVDTTPPVVTVPANKVVEATSAEGAVATFSASASDLVDGSVDVTCAPASGDVFPLGTTTVTCSATDTHDNTGSNHFSVTVVDTTPPALSLPADFELEATSANGAVATFTATATDLVDGSVEVTCTPPSGATFKLGDTTVSCSARDKAGNEGKGTFQVSVVDTTPPVVTVPADQTVEAEGPDGASSTFAASANDLVDGNVPVTCAPESGSTFALGTTTVTCTATDTHGNTGSNHFSVSVVDTTPPALSLPADVTQEATGSSGAVVSFTASANDAVDGPVATTCSPASGSTFALGSTAVTCTATDAHHNTSSGSFTVTVVDTTPPTVTVPADMKVEATSAAGAVATFTATATDLVDGSDTTACSPASGSTFALGKTAVTCTATDAHGNKGSASFMVEVVDTTPPALSLPDDILVRPTGTSGAVVTFSATATDLVDGNVPVTCTRLSGSVFPLGTTTVSCSATDARGNNATGTFKVAVLYDWSGFLQPINDTAHQIGTATSVFKAGSTVPVKLQLKGADGRIITPAAAPQFIGWIRGSLMTEAIDESLYQDVPTSGSAFRWDAAAQQWIYNWSTKSLKAGYWYRMYVSLDDGTIETVTIGLR